MRIRPTPFFWRIPYFSSKRGQTKITRQTFSSLVSAGMTKRSGALANLSANISLRKKKKKKRKKLKLDTDISCLDSRKKQNKTVFTKHFTFLLSIASRPVREYGTQFGCFIWKQTPEAVPLGIIWDTGRALPVCTISDFQHGGWKVWICDSLWVHPNFLLFVT